MRRRSRKKSIRKITVPNLSGLTRSQAQAALSALGLTYSESTTNTSDSLLGNTIYSQDFTAGSTVVNGTVFPFVYYNYVDPGPVITYGPCEAYGSGTNAGSGTQCSGNYYQSYTDYTYNTRKKIYSNGSWDGTSYTTSGCGTTTERTINSSSQVDGQCGYTAPVSITYGACEAYGGAIQNLGSGSYCSGTSTVYYTTYRYNAQRKIYVNGSWDGSSYTTSGCSTVDATSITSSGQVEGSCGYTNPISYGSCQAYGSALYPVNSGTQCSGTYYQTYTVNAYNARRTILVNGSWDGSSYDTSSCGYINQTDITGSSQIDGYCGYTAPAPAAQWYCTESYNGGGVGNCGYSMPGYNNSGSGSGFSRQCTLGYSYPGCQSTNPYVPPPACSTYKYQCKSYDVTNSASNNYYQCYSVGQCAANNNSDGSRASCCAD
jgi:hypothetical protein